MRQAEAFDKVVKDQVNVVEIHVHPESETLKKLKLQVQALKEQNETLGNIQNFRSSTEKNLDEFV